MAELKVRIEGLSEVTAKLRQLGERGRVEYIREMKRSANALASAWRKYIKPHRNTGEAEEKIDVEYWEQGARGSGATIFGTAKQLLFLEFGTKAHTIEPKKSKWLAFFWPKVGTNVFAKKVRHPGTAAHLYLTKAWISVMGTNGAKFIKRLKNRILKVSLK